MPREGENARNLARVGRAIEPPLMGIGETAAGSPPCVEIVRGALVAASRDAQLSSGAT